MTRNRIPTATLKRTQGFYKQLALETGKGNTALTHHELQLKVRIQFLIGILFIGTYIFFIGTYEP